MLHDELTDLVSEASPGGFQVVAVALDEDLERVRPLAEAITYPVLIDREHRLADLLAISNVPTVLWVDEDLGLARPNQVAFGTDTFTEFHGIDPSGHMDAVRRWVETGDSGLAEADAAEAVPELDENELRARLLFRVGAHLVRSGRPEEGADRLREASALVPHDFTVWRAAMPLMGEDPFGEGFFEGYQRWQDDGGRYHGLSADV